LFLGINSIVSTGRFSIVSYLKKNFERSINPRLKIYRVVSPIRFDRSIERIGCVGCPKNMENFETIARKIFEKIFG
jgi:hypothetical protein